MKKYLNVIKKCVLFRGIESAHLNAIFGCLGAELKTYRKKESVFSEGDPAKYVGVVMSGSVRVMQVDYYGNRSIMANVEAAELFGETFACAGVDSLPVDVVANEDTEVLLIDCDRILKSCSNACEFHRQMIYNLMKVVAKKNLLLHQKITITSKRSTREKLMAYLMHQAKQNNCNEFEIPYDRQELADYLEVDRSGLSAEISKMRKEGIIESQKNYFKLL